MEMVGIPTWEHILAIGLGHNIIHGQNQHQIKERMTDYIKEPHTTIFNGPTVCGEIYLVLDLIEKEYNKHFDYIIIICPTLQWNKTYHSRDWIKNDDKVWLIEPKDKLYQCIEKLSQLLACSEILFIIDDMCGTQKKGQILKLYMMKTMC